MTRPLRSAVAGASLCVTRRGQFNQNFRRAPSPSRRLALLDGAQDDAFEVERFGDAEEDWVVV